MLMFGAVEVGMSKTMSSVPGRESLLAWMIASRSEPGPESLVFTTRNVEKVGLLWLAIVTIAVRIVPRVAPPIGWPSARLMVENGVVRLGLARIGIANGASVWFGANVSVPETPV